ncbi:Meiotically up-regulated gene 157 (Mug157) protein [Thermoanaerobacter thermohydrosulfuricus]|uniref:Meiotically up-regulated gene 157 (Mug157) protein n=1 Tax=Thermoanaerobacter thermohydrosulfuricus TaxID=1516 RepID=A0A1G7M4L4_THETY|nr:glycoside hydrolase family 125 protein [Thermoanaerobacter thermohydrosulfuricus]SDF56089.1 Meiotically up-regulated gene 157 (Mug157) protein [Thermoanaerobacter thermohydrosulfuricus]
MNKIITRPHEIDKNVRVLYAGNHYISLPEIDVEKASIKNLNIVSLSNKGLVELSGEEALFKPVFYKKGEKLEIVKSEVSEELYYIPNIKLYFSNGDFVIIKIYADIKEKGFVYEFESSEEIEVYLEVNLDKLFFLRFNSHEIEFKKEFKIDKWLKNPALNIYSYNIAFSLAFGGEKDFDYEEKNEKIILKSKTNGTNCFYISVNSDMDGASTTLIHLKRKGFKNIYKEFYNWLKSKYIKYSQDKDLESLLNKNLFFNYFFSIGKDMESDNYIALTSRSPRYYVSGAFWERDSFLWSFPAIKIIDKSFHDYIAREMILRHSKNAGDHAHYIDGTVLYPGFELDEAASYFILLENMDVDLDDIELVKALEVVYSRIEEEYDSRIGLYKTFLLPSDDPSEYPFVTIDNVILWRGFINLKNLYLKLNWYKKADMLQKKIDGIYNGIYKYLVTEVEGKRIFAWSTDGEGNYKLYNDPPGNLGLMYYYDFVDYQNEVFRNTIDYYYSRKYKYYFEDAKIKELACDHHPNTPSGLGLCGSLLNPLMRKEALKWLKMANMDYGLLAESFDKDTGEAKTGVGFATGSGYLAMALYRILFEE